MIKKKLAAFAVAALAACSISSTAAFAESYPFGGVTLTTNGPKYGTVTRVKTDELYAVVNVEEGLAGGDYFATFEVHKYVNDSVAAGPKDLWINGKHHLDYKPGMGIKGERYFLVYYMKSQANADRIAIRGTWEP